MRISLFVIALLLLSTCKSLGRRSSQVSEGEGSANSVKEAVVIFVSPTGLARQWLQEGDWQDLTPDDLVNLRLPGPSNDHSTQGADFKIENKAKILKWNGDHYILLGSAPNGATIANAVQDAAGNILVQLDGNIGFSFLSVKSRSTEILEIANWEGKTLTGVINIVSSPDSQGFLLLTSNKELYFVDALKKSRGTLTSRLIADKVDELLKVNSEVIVRSGETFQVVESSKEKPVLKNLKVPGRPHKDAKVFYVSSEKDINELQKYLEQYPSSFALPPGREKPAQVTFRGSLEKKLTYEQFETLVKHKVTQLDLMEKFWKSAPEVTQGFYFAGGRLRGLLKWIHGQLQNYSYDEVLKKSPPKVDDLSLLKDSSVDYDVYTDLDPEIVKKYFSGWDVLGPEFYKGSVLSGGATIEKLKVNPWKIEDPYQSLRAFYQGRLEFAVTSDEDFAKAAQFGVNNNSRTALALRFLRFVNDLDCVEPDPKTLETLGKALEKEFPKMPSSENYWINKALTRFLMAYSNNGKLLEGIAWLRKFGLLKTLGLEGFKILGVYSLKTFDKETKKFFQEQQFTVEDIVDVERLLVSDVTGEIIRFREFALYFANTNDDLAKILDFNLPKKSTPSDFYFQKLDAFIGQLYEGEIRVEGKNFKGNPYLLEIAQRNAQSIRKESKFNKFAAACTRLGCTNMPEEFLKSLEDVTEEIQEKIAQKYVEQFLKLQNIQDSHIKHYLSLITNPDVFHEVASKLVPLINSPTRFLVFVTAYNARITNRTDFIDEHLNLFFSLNPSFFDMNTLISMSSSAETKAKIVERALPLAKTAEQFASMVAYTGVTSAFQAPTAAVINRQLDYFFSLNPTPKDIESVIWSSADVNVVIRVMDMAVKARILDAEHLLKIVTRNRTSTVSSAQTQIIREACNVNMGLFESLAPTYPQMRNYASFITGIRGYYSETIAKYATTSEDFLFEMHQMDRPYDPSNRFATSPELIEKFMSLNPTPEEVKQAMERFKVKFPLKFRIATLRKYVEGYNSPIVVLQYFQQLISPIVEVKSPEDKIALSEAVNVAASKIDPRWKRELKHLVFFYAVDEKMQKEIAKKYNVRRDFIEACAHLIEKVFNLK